MMTQTRPTHNLENLFQDIEIESFQMPEKLLWTGVLLRMISDYQEAMQTKSRKLIDKRWDEAHSKEIRYVCDAIGLPRSLYLRKLYSLTPKEFFKWREKLSAS